MGLFDLDKSASRLPVSVITGFLGSGKTTLLNKLLRHAGMADSAVIINEFGDVGLDHLLVEAVDGEIAVLASGCVCCTLRSDLEQTLHDLLVRRDYGQVPAFSRILVETTGLADPAPIVQLLLNNPLVSHFMRLDTVVTTVDAVNGLRQIDEHAEAVKQAALADRLLLTKADLAAAEAIEELRRRLVALNPGATWHIVSHGEIAPDALFGAALFDPSRKTVDVRRWINEAAYETQGQDHGDHEHDHKGHGHGTDIRAYCLSVDQPLSWDSFSSWLGRVRRGAGEDLLRVKGILNLIGESAPVAIHGVHHIFHPPVQLHAWPDADRRSRIVFITRGIDRADLEASFLEHVAASGEFDASVRARPSQIAPPGE
jgi:G3E family GTPase